MSIEVSKSGPVTAALPQRTSSQKVMLAPLTREFLHDVLAQALRGVEVTAWSEQEFSFLQKVSPYYAKKLGAVLGIACNQSPQSIELEARAAAQSVFLTLDNPLMRQHTNNATIRSKRANLALAFEALGEEGLPDEQALLALKIPEAVFQLKQAASRILSKRPGEVRLQLVPRRERSEVAAAVRKIFGDNLRAIFHYGSSVSGNGKDIDLFVVLKSLSAKQYADCAGALTEVRIKDKPIGAVLYTESNFYTFAEYTEEQAVSGKEIVQLWGGSMHFPCLSVQARIQNDLFKSGKELRSLRSVLSHGPRFERLPYEGGLLSYFLKLEAWIARALLQAAQERIISKSELFDLACFPTLKVPLPRETNAIAEALIGANLRTAERIQQLLENSPKL
jgi:hypothetical protein